MSTVRQCSFKTSFGHGVWFQMAMTNKKKYCIYITNNKTWSPSIQMTESYSAVFTRRRQLSRGACGHRSAATPSGGSTSPGRYPGRPALPLPSRRSTKGPCPGESAIANSEDVKGGPLTFSKLWRWTVAFSIVTQMSIVRVSSQDSL